MKENNIVIMDGHSFKKSDVIQAIDLVANDLYRTGDISKSIGILNSLDGLDVIIGHAKAKLLWSMSRWWSENNNSENDFYDHIDATSNTRGITAQRYVNVWEQIEQENIPKKIQARPMRDLVPIAGMLSQGFDPTKKQWEEIGLASNSSDLSEIIRKIKGKKPRKSGLKIYLERDGSLNIWKDNKKTYLGFLDVEEAKTDPDVDKAVERIVSGAQIIRR